MVHTGQLPLAEVVSMIDGAIGEHGKHPDVEVVAVMLTALDSYFMGPGMLHPYFSRMTSYLAIRSLGYSAGPEVLAAQRLPIEKDSREIQDAMALFDAGVRSPPTPVA